MSHESHSGRERAVAYPIRARSATEWPPCIRRAHCFPELNTTRNSTGQQLANGTASQRKYELMFEKPGQYDIFVYAWNHVQHRTDPYILSFRVMEPIEGERREHITGIDAPENEP